MISRLFLEDMQIGVYFPGTHVFSLRKEDKQIKLQPKKALA